MMPRLKPSVYSLLLAFLVIGKKFYDFGSGLLLLKLIFIDILLILPLATWHGKWYKLSDTDTSRNFGISALQANLICHCCFLFISGSCSCVRIVNFNVPQYSSLKSDVTLTCEFEMTEGPEERLHSVKWYRFSNSKHMEEFYSWKPKRQPPATRHHIHAVRIDVS